MTDERWLTPKEVGELLGKSQYTIVRWLQAGYLDGAPKPSVPTHNKMALLSRVHPHERSTPRHGREGFPGVHAP
jgi:hypothetical protein